MISFTIQTSWMGSPPRLLHVELARHLLHHRDKLDGVGSARRNPQPQRNTPMTAYEKLKTLLKELLQLDQPDLDFGLYRIMHAKAAEVTQFLERDLLPQVRQALAAHESAELAEARQALADRVELRQRLGDDPEQDDEVKRLRKRIAAAGAPAEQLEAEVYDHLYGFFRRYYSEGDFLSKRVYKPGVYAIPYEGEEVKLHWANADQYYIKTSEYLRDYAFRLRPDDDANPMRVHFQLVDAAEGEHGNVKPAAAKDRVFVLAAHDFLALQAGEQAEELAIRFEYRPATLADWPDDSREGKTKPPTQKELVEIAERRIGHREQGTGDSTLRSRPAGDSLPFPPGEGRSSASVGNGLRAVPPVGEQAPSPPSAGDAPRAAPHVEDGLPGPSSHERDGLGRQSSGADPGNRLPLPPGIGIYTSCLVRRIGGRVKAVRSGGGAFFQA